MLCSAQDILHPFNLDNTTSLCSSRMDGVKLFVQGKCRLTCRASEAGGWEGGGKDMGVGEDGGEGVEGGRQSLQLLSPASCNWCLQDRQCNGCQVFTVSISSIINVTFIITIVVNIVFIMITSITIADHKDHRHHREVG